MFAPCRGQRYQHGGGQSPKVMTTNGKSGLNLNFEIAILCVKIKSFD